MRAEYVTIDTVKGVQMEHPYIGAVLMANGRMAVGGAKDRIAFENKDFTEVVLDVIHFKRLEDEAHPIKK